MFANFSNFDDRKSDIGVRQRPTDPSFVGQYGIPTPLPSLSLQVNPYLFLPSLALSTSTFEAIFLTLMFAFEGEFAQLSKRYAFTYIPQENHK